LLEGGLAVGLELAEHGHILFHAALDAGGVEGDPFEAFVVGQPGTALGEGNLDFGLVVAWFEDADVESEDGVFDGGGALQLPAAVGDGLDEAGFEIVGGAEVLGGVAAVFVVGDLCMSRVSPSRVSPRLSPVSRGRLQGRYCLKRRGDILT
jgi:hypothetical protein